VGSKRRPCRPLAGAGEGILEKHVQTFFAGEHEVAFDMELAGDIAADEQVSPLLTPGHVGDIVEQVHYNHIVGL
jgi:hypothetical protein